MTRINRVLEHMAKLQVDSVIIKDVTTIRYLTGFTGDSSLLYLDICAFTRATSSDGLKGFVI